MKRKIVKIDEEKCNGCASCIPNCQEGALQIIDGKARLISDLFCDGLGACLGHCPEGAITIEEREATPYNERKVMEVILKQGINTISAHLKHLTDHNETVYYNKAIEFLKENNIDIDALDFDKAEKVSEVKGCSSCLGSQTLDFREETKNNSEQSNVNVPSELLQWPIQLHLVGPNASYLKNADVLLAADCTAFAMGSFHASLMKGKSIAIACPKLDSDIDEYVDKIKTMVDEALIKSLTVVIMEVPCCGGLLKIAQLAVEKANRKLPIHLIIINIKGTIIKKMTL
jgi:ferredoxin